MSQEAIAIFTLDGCGPCEEWKEEVEKLVGEDLEVVEINVEENEEAMKFLAKYGHNKVPITYRGEMEGEEFVPAGDWIEGKDVQKLKEWKELEEKKEVLEELFD